MERVSTEGPVGSGLRDRIILQALQLIPERGVEGITMRILARRLGYSPATLYLHFRSKAELLREVAQTGFAQLRARLDERAVEGEPEQILAETARVYVAFGLANPELYRVMFDWRPAWQSDVRAAVFEPCLDAFARGIAQGTFRRQDPAAALMLYAGALHGAVQMAYAQGEGPDPGTLADWLVSDRLAAIRATPVQLGRGASV